MRALTPSRQEKSASHQSKAQVGLGASGMRITAGRLAGFRLEGRPGENPQPLGPRSRPTGRVAGASCVRAGPGGVNLRNRMGGDLALALQHPACQPPASSRKPPTRQPLVDCQPATSGNPQCPLAHLRAGCWLLADVELAAGCFFPEGLASNERPVSWLPSTSSLQACQLVTYQLPAVTYQLVSKRG
jgi:hypothetical protein